MLSCYILRRKCYVVGEDEDLYSFKEIVDQKETQG